ncbi:hypothetical protein [Deinococcus sp. 12RED42]|uniref:hypothetical protein n=1 Tax=Deinococcus sp. 12RED42 TaxID=2745872 RepID=UPI001E56305B|nr:hypothetical protein [Deinococcus sp. 12RED42]MCD0164614.1 hypothetical protein [Deinococcus sp. 12RED42]
MAAPEPTVTTVDLRTDVPAGWTLAGLSGPKFDGVNYYRVPQADRSTLTFTLDAAQFVELEYQLYSPAQAVTAILRLGDQVIHQRTFAAGRFEPNERAGTFVPAGTHTVSWEYQCEGQPCTAPVSQYWTQVRTVALMPAQARQAVGLHTQRLLLDAPDTPLSITGTSTMRFEGSNFLRYINNPQVKLFWPKGKVLNASLYVHASQPFRVTTTIQGKVVDIQQGNALMGVSPPISLVGFPDANSLTMTVECLGVVSTYGCAYLQFPQVTLDTTAPVTVPVLGGAALAVVMGLTALWRLLAPVRA